MWTGAPPSLARPIADRVGLAGDRAEIPVAVGTEEERSALAVAVDMDHRTPVEVWRPIADACADEPFVPVLTALVVGGLADLALQPESDPPVVPGTPRPDSDAPSDVVAAAGRWTDADLDRVLDTHLDGWRSEPGDVDREVDRTRGTLGSAPDATEVPDGLSMLDLDRWLYDWEDAHGAVPGGTNPVDYLVVFPMAVVFVPVEASWHVAAVQGQFDVDPIQTCARLARWRRRHGGEVVVMDGTGLQVAVDRPVAGREEAWTTACELDVLGPGALHVVGSPLRDQARALRTATTWTAWSKP